jgi:hypothetical protein
MNTQYKLVTDRPPVKEYGIDWYVYQGKDPRYPYRGAIFTCKKCKGKRFVQKGCYKRALENGNFTGFCTVCANGARQKTRLGRTRPKGKRRLDPFNLVDNTTFNANISAFAEAEARGSYLIDYGVS